MSARTVQQKKGAPLPDQITGHDEICLTMKMPYAPEYVAAVRGVLSLLGKWWHWEKTYEAGDTRATEAATYWRDFLETINFTFDCTGIAVEPITNLRFVDCALQYSYDFGQTWLVVEGFDPECFKGDKGDPGADCNDCANPEPDEDDGGVDNPDLPPGDGTRCDVANFVANSILDNYYIPLLESYGEQVIDNELTIEEFIRRFIPAYFPITALTALTQLLAGLDLAAVTAKLNDANDATNREEFACDLYCVLNEEGNITASVYAEWKSKIGGNPDYTGNFQADILAFLETIPLYQLRVEAGLAADFGGTADCSECDCDDCPEEEQILTVIDATEGTWSTALVTYGNGSSVPIRQSRNWWEGDMVVTLPGEWCITSVRVCLANQSGRGYARTWVELGGQVAPEIVTKQTTTCNANLAASNNFDFATPIRASSIRIRGGMPSGSGNTNAPPVVHCIRILHNEND